MSYLQDVFALACVNSLSPCERLPLGVLAPFARVLLEDSTHAVHAKLAEDFKGSGGSARTPALKLDVIDDVIHLAWWRCT